MTLHDLNGRQLSALLYNEQRKAGVHRETMPLSQALPAGMYILNISNGVRSFGVKIVKQ